MAVDCGATVDGPLGVLRTSRAIVAGQLLTEIFTAARPKRRAKPLSAMRAQPALSRLHRSNAVRSRRLSHMGLPVPKTSAMALTRVHLASHDGQLPVQADIRCKLIAFIPVTGHHG